MTSSDPGSSQGSWLFRRPTWQLFILILVVGSVVLVVGVVAVSVVVQEVARDLEDSNTANDADAASSPTTSVADTTTTTLSVIFETGLNVGQCLDGGELDAYLAGGDFSYVSCGEAHDYEVYFVHEFPVGPYPGDDAVIEDLKAVCRNEFDGYVGRDYESSALNTFSVWPGQGLWENGNRTGECLLFDTDGDTLTGSAHQSSW